MNKDFVTGMFLTYVPNIFNPLSLNVKLHHCNKICFINYS